MIEFISEWAKDIGLAIVIVSVIEMLLPENKNKKYIRMILGIYVLFNILSPILADADELIIIDLETYEETISSEYIETKIDKTSMDDRIKQIYIEEIEKDILEKLTKKNYEVKNITVDATIAGENEEETRITKIDLKIDKLEPIENNDNTNDKNENIENIVIENIQKIKPIEINESDKQNTIQSEDETLKISTVDIQNIKQFLIEEYGVSEQCLVIN